jgi:NifB/MoaA-like Fe-S oxidoreductase
VPLGVSDHTTEPDMRAHTKAEAARVLDTVEAWQTRFLDAHGRRLAYAADEYYLLAGRPFPPLDAYDALDQHENGVGMARAFEAEVRAALSGEVRPIAAARPGFFAWVEGAPADGYRALRTTAVPVALRTTPPPAAAPPPVTIVTGAYGAEVLAPLVGDLAVAAHATVTLLPVGNDFFGGNIAVTGLLTGADVSRALASVPSGTRVLLPDVVLSNGRFLDGVTVGDLPRAVEVVATDGAALVAALVP